jgi:hypothetical protein
MKFYKIENSVLVSVDNKPLINENAEQVYINIDFAEKFGEGTGGYGDIEVSKHQNKITGLNYEFNLLEISKNRYTPLELWKFDNIYDEVIVFEDMGDFYCINFITDYEFANDPMLKEFWLTYQW